MTTKNYKTANIAKAIILFFTYIFYQKIGTLLFKNIGIYDNILTSFIADLLFFIIVIFIYRNDLKKEFKAFNNDYSLKNRCKIIFKSLFIILLINIIISFISSLFLPDNIDEINNIQSLVNNSIPYLIFKSLIFSAIIETLVFQVSIRVLINKKIIFILISSLVFTLMNLAYTNLDSSYLIFDAIGYFTMSLIFAYIYVKTDNIFFIVFIKIIYNIIPLLANIVLLMEVI